MLNKINKNKIIMPLSIIVGALILGVAFILISYQNKTNGLMSGVLPAKTAAEKTINYINENILVGVSSASLVDILDEGSVYKIRLKIEEMEFDSYISKDGKFLFPEGYNMEEDFAQTSVTETPEQPEPLPLTQEELEEFVNCLKNKGMVIYGEEWCPYCQQLVALFGGKETVEPIYVDCGEQKELCYTEKGITGVPAIFINDKEYLGARSLEAFIQETGCSLY